MVYTGFALGMWLPELARRAAPQTFEGQLRNLAYWSRRVVAGSPLAETDRLLAHCFVLIVDPALLLTTVQIVLTRYFLRRVLKRNIY